MFVFYFFAALLVWQSVMSLRGGKRYLAYVQAELAKPQAVYTPFASIIVPCRGVDQGLAENIRALLNQDYPSYEVIFVTDDAADPSLAVIEGAIREAAVKGTNAQIVIAGSAINSSQKVHNLIAATNRIGEASEVLVFVDTDARPQSSWLRALVAPLADESIGAATGYRWFIPVRGHLASHLRAVWNASIASALGANTRRNFCWGGSTAIRRATFENLKMRERWCGTLSDDFALTHALHEAKLLIHFVPQCLTPSFEDCTLSELLEFTTRQIKITRVYAPPLWVIVLWSNLVFTLVFFGGIALFIRHVISNRASDATMFAPLMIVLVIYLLGAAKAGVRLQAVQLAFNTGGGTGIRFSRAALLAQMTLFPLTAVLYLYNALAALFSRRITWRGITYELKSPTETEIISGATPHTDRARKLYVEPESNE